MRSEVLTRIGWRLGRRLYMNARGEQRGNAFADNGERFLQSCVVAATGGASPLTVFDIGANRGEWTLSLLDALPAARQRPGATRILAFEPVPETAAMLRGAIDAHPARAVVTLCDYGLSAAPGEARMAVFGAGAGTNSLHPDTAATAWRPVPLSTVDKVCAEAGIGHVHLVKCDAEGHDAHVIAGAAQMLAAGRIDVFQFEYNHRWVPGRAYLRDVFAAVSGLPYTLARVDPDRLARFDDWHPELERFFQSNYALVHDRALGWFPLHQGQFDGANTYA